MSWQTAYKHIGRMFAS